MRSESQICRRICDARRLVSNEKPVRSGTRGHALQPILYCHADSCYKHQRGLANNYSIHDACWSPICSKVLHPLTFSRKNPSNY